jgi:hypothetical protein
VQAVGDGQWLQLAIELVQRRVCIGGRVLGAVGERECGCAGWGVGAADLGEELLIVGVRRVLESLLAKLSFACESAKGVFASVHVHGSHQCTRGAQWLSYLWLPSEGREEAVRSSSLLWSPLFSELMSSRDLETEASRPWKL